MTSKEPVRVVLVEDHAPTRGATTRMLADFGARVVLLEAFPDGEACLRSQVTGTADVALVDLGLPGMSGADVIAALAQSTPRVRALALTAFDHEKSVFQALGAGAFGYLLKDEPPERIVRAIEEAAEGAHPISARVAGFLVSHARGSLSSIQLSGREDELAMRLSEGLSYAECAGRMGISLGTVQDYVKRLYRKLDVNSRREVREWVERRARLS